MISSRDSDCTSELQGAPRYLAHSCSGIDVPASHVQSITRYPKRAVRRVKPHRLSTAEIKPGHVAG